jgi:hypothetical protein
LIVVDEGINLAFNSLPHLVETFFTKSELVSETFEIWLDAELVVGGGVSKVKTSGDGEIGLEN